MPDLTRADLDDATAIVRRFLPSTPTYRWPLLCDEVGTDVWVKHENHLPVGAFKVRGGLVFVERLRARRPDVTGLAAATRGNHGQSIAFAGGTAGLPVTIVVPHGNSADKNAAMRGLGATVVEVGHDFQEAREYAASLADHDPGLEVVPAFHPDLVAGVATYAAELFGDAPGLDTVYVPVGMGSGISALIAVRDLLGLSTEIVGVVSERADSTARSFRAGHPVPTDAADTFVDGVATRMPEAESVRRMVGGAARVLTVSEDATAEAIRVLLRTTHNVAEPAGAIALAGAMGEDVSGKRIAVVLTGGNIDSAMLAEVLAGRTPAPPSAGAAQTSTVSAGASGV